MYCIIPINNYICVVNGTGNSFERIENNPQIIYRKGFQTIYLPQKPKQ
jgi:hypothetical protein